MNCICPVQELPEDPDGDSDGDTDEDPDGDSDGDTDEDSVGDSDEDLDKKEIGKMSSHGKKMLAPVIITIIFLLYLCIYGAMLMHAVVEEPLAILLAIPLVLLGIGIIYMLYARIQEIRSGEEDDLDNY